MNTLRDDTDGPNPEFRIIASGRLGELVRSLEVFSPFSHLPETVSARDAGTALKWALEGMELEWFYNLDGEYVEAVGPKGSDAHYFVRNPRFGSFEGRFEHHGVEVIGEYRPIMGSIGDTELFLIDRYIEVRVCGEEDVPGIALTPFMPDQVVEDLLYTLNPHSILRP